MAFTHYTSNFTIMQTMEELKQAIINRHSVRAYKAEPLTKSETDILQSEISRINAEGDLHVQLITQEPKAFSGRLAKYGKFQGVENYLVVAGKSSSTLSERAGYYCEQIVLKAQAIGLNTCWVGLSYSRVPDTYVLDEGERIVCYIAIGHGQTQGVSHKIKTVEQVSNADSAPEWFRKGVEAALLAPTAVNQQKFRFEFVAPRTVVAKRLFSLVGYTKLDLGIVKCHFEIGAGRDNFEWKE